MLKTFTSKHNTAVSVGLEDNGEEFVVKNPIGELKFDMFDLEDMIGLLIDLQSYMESNE